MKKHLPGILFLLAMPCAVLLFVKVQESTGSDIVALLASVLFYIAVFVVCALVFNNPDPRNEKMEHPVVKENASQDGDAAQVSDAADSPNAESAGAKEDK